MRDWGAKSPTSVSAENAKMHFCSTRRNLLSEGDRNFCRSFFQNTSFAANKKTRSITTKAYREKFSFHYPLELERAVTPGGKHILRILRKQTDADNKRLPKCPCGRNLCTSRPRPVCLPLQAAPSGRMRRPFRVWNQNRRQPCGSGREEPATEVKGSAE